MVTNVTPTGWCSWRTVREGHLASLYNDLVGNILLTSIREDPNTLESVHAQGHSYIMSEMPVSYRLLIFKTSLSIPELGAIKKTHRRKPVRSRHTQIRAAFVEVVGLVVTVLSPRRLHTVITQTGDDHWHVGTMAASAVASEDSSWDCYFFKRKEERPCKTFLFWNQIGVSRGGWVNPRRAGLGNVRE